MVTYINEKIAAEAAEHGTLIGKTEPCRETKGMWWEVYSYRNELIACGCDSVAGICFGERLTLNELERYCDDLLEARNNYERLSQ